MSETVEIGGGGGYYYSAPEDLMEREIPPPPEFAETTEQLIGVNKPIKRLFDGT